MTADPMPDAPDAGPEPTVRGLPSRPVPYSAGMEVAPTTRSPSPLAARPVVWEPYHGPRFSRRTRVLLTLVVAALPGLFIFAAVVQIVLGEGRERAASVIMLLPVVAMVPLVLWAWRDLWGERH